MRKIIYRLLIVSLVLFCVVPQHVMAFSFTSPYSANAYLNESAVPKTLGNITSRASGEASVMVRSGSPTPSSKDTVKIQSITLGGGISSREFTVQVGIENIWTDSASSVGRCVWYNSSCDTNQESKNNVPTIPVSVRLVRNSTNSYATIPSGTLIATVKLTHYSIVHPTGSTVNDEVAYLYFYTTGDITPVIPTCDVKNFDKNVTLPDVRRSDIVREGIGRYTGATKEFNINLACENTPKVSIKFDGDKMPGVASEDVLVNKLSGNDNVGVQIVYNSNPLKIGSNVAVINSAEASETLKFNAYYYYKGGTVQSGSIKSQTEFTFTYE